MWPFRKPEPEKRAAGGPFGDSVASAFYAAAVGSNLASPLALGALETAAGLWSRGFAAAEVEGTAALPAPVLAHIARELVRRGESIHVIDVREGRVRLIPVGTWDVRGGPAPEDWFYRCDVFGASEHHTFVRPASSVLHVRYAYDAVRPWLGVSPLTWAARTGALAGWLEQRLGEEASAAAGYLLPMPDRHGAEGGDDDGAESDPLAQFKTDLANIKGKTLLVESTAGGYGDRAASPQAEFTPRRIGAAVPEGNVKLRAAAAESVLNACGVPVSLTGHGEAAGLREAWRVFLHGTLAPIGRIIEHEASEKLGGPVRIDFSALMASDLQGRARAFRSLVDGGIEVGAAATLAGFEA